MTDRNDFEAPAGSSAGNRTKPVSGEAMPAGSDAGLLEWLLSDSTDDTAIADNKLASVLRQALDDDELRPFVDDCRTIAGRYRRNRPDRDPAPVSKRKYATLFASAAAVAASVVAVTNIDRFGANTVQYQTLVGEQKSAILDDGTVLTLNTDTRVSVHYTDESRRVALSRGEAFFDVQKDPNRPFEVAARGSIVRAVGTEFNVALRENAASVVVLEGTVDVIPGNAPAIQNGDDGTQKDPARVSVGEGVRFWSNGVVAQVEKVDVRPINAWRRGRLQFVRMRLSDAVAEHNRYTTQKILIGSDSIENMLISGIIEIGDTPSLIFLLKNSLNVDAIYGADAIVIMPRPNSGSHTASRPH